MYALSCELIGEIAADEACATGDACSFHSWSLRSVAIAPELSIRVQPPDDVHDANRTSSGDEVPLAGARCAATRSEHKACSLGILAKHPYGGKGEVFEVAP
jgi:hypothetical protein